MLGPLAGHRGADIDLFLCPGETPLNAAVRSSQYAVVRFLLSRGADPDRSSVLPEFPDDVSTARNLIRTSRDRERPSRREEKNDVPNP